MAAATNAAVGIPAANVIAGTYISTVALTAAGQITVTYGANANAKISGKTLVYTAYASPNGDIAWVCNDGNAATNAITQQNLVVVNGGAGAVNGSVYTTNPSYLPSVCQ